MTVVNIVNLHTIRGIIVSRKGKAYSRLEE